MTTTEDDRWLAALAGRNQADSPETRQATALREVLLTEMELLDQPDPARQQRIRNLVEARLAAERASASSPEPGLWARAMNWIFPEGGGHSLRRAGLAAGLVAAIAVPLVLNTNRDGGADDPSGIKSVPKIGVPTDSVVQRLPSSDPDKTMGQVVSILASAGVAADVQADGTARLVNATVPPDQRANVAEALRGLGIALPADGRLQVRLEPAQ